MDSRGGARMTVERFTIIFLLPPAEQYHRTLSNLILISTMMTGKGLIVYIVVTGKSLKSGRVA